MMSEASRTSKVNKKEIIRSSLLVACTNKYLSLTDLLRAYHAINEKLPNRLIYFRVGFHGENFGLIDPKPCFYSSGDNMRKISYQLSKFQCMVYLKFARRWNLEVDSFVRNFSSPIVTPDKIIITGKDHSFLIKKLKVGFEIQLSSSSGIKVYKLDMDQLLGMILLDEKYPMTSYHPLSSYSRK